MRIAPIQLFAQSLQFAHVGHVPYERHVFACEHAQSKGWTEGALIKRVAESLSLDINPLVQLASLVPDLSGFGAAFNLYNSRSNLGWRTLLDFKNDRELAVTRERFSLSDGVELSIAKDCTLACAEVLIDGVDQRGRGRSIDLIAPSVSALVERLGLSATPFWEASLFFESEPEGKVSDLANQLGCSARTLNRAFDAHGVRATELKQVVMLIKASRMFALPLTLTEIAHECGYFDLAHFTRSFKRSVGVTPSAMRKAAFGL